MIEAFTPRSKKIGLRKLAVCGRTWLIVVNSIFTIIGGSCTGIGCVFKYDSGLIHQYVQPILREMGHDGDEKSFAELYEMFSKILIGLGLSVFFIGMLGCFGAWCKLKTSIAVYTFVVLVVTVAEVICAILLFTMRNKIDEGLQPELQILIRDHYTGDTGTDITTLAFNFMFTRFDCCGIHNYTDLYLATNWDRSVVYHGFTLTTTIPVMCCKMEGNFPHMARPNDETCVLFPNSINSNYNKGCYEEVINLLNEQEEIIWGCGTGVLLLEVVSLAASIHLLKELLIIKRKVSALHGACA